MQRQPGAHPGIVVAEFGAEVEALLQVGPTRGEFGADREVSPPGRAAASHGDFQLGRRKFAFRVKADFPKTLTKEFLLVDLVNNLDQLAENKQEVLARVAEKAASYDVRRLERASHNYGNVKTRKFFSSALKPAVASHAD